MELIKNFLANDKDKVTYIKILAKDKFVGEDKKKIKSFGLDKLKNITLQKIQETSNSSYFQSIRKRIIILYKSNIMEKFKAIKKKVNSLIDNIQSSCIILLNFENYFLELLNLIYFHDNENHNIKDSLKENIKDYINDNNNLIDDNRRLLNQNANGKQIPMYDNFLNKITESYITEYELKIKKIYDDIIKECFPHLINSTVRKTRFLSDFIKELRNYVNIELDENIDKENQFIDLEFDEIKDINEDLIMRINNEENFDGDDNNNILNVLENNAENNKNDNNNKSKGTENNIENNNKVHKTIKYKIDNSDIIQLKFIEHNVIIQIMQYFTNEILEYIKSYMLSKNQIKNLQKLIDDEIIEMIKKFR